MSRSSSSTSFALCTICKAELQNCESVSVEGGSMCLSCFEMEYANRCNFCRKLVRVGQKQVSFDEKHWHDTCFNCSLCNSSLLNRHFAFSNSQLVCTECYRKETSIECCKCLENFKNGQPIYEFEGMHWHDDCFRCSNCDFHIGAKPFIPAGASPTCMDCFDQKFARYCCRCSKALKNGGMECGDACWHNECFSCSLCFKSLCNGQDFVSKKREIFCTDCYTKKFFKRCFRCSTDIDTQKGLKFINFENMNWHTKCFICQKCSCALVDKGFVKCGGDILCPSCAKANNSNSTI